MQHPIARGHHVHMLLLEGLEEVLKVVHNIAATDLNTDVRLVHIDYPSAVEEHEDHLFFRIS